MRISYACAPPWQGANEALFAIFHLLTAFWPLGFESVCVFMAKGRFSALYFKSTSICPRHQLFDNSQQLSHMQKVFWKFNTDGIPNCIGLSTSTTSGQNESTPSACGFGWMKFIFFATKSSIFSTIQWKKAVSRWFYKSPKVFMGAISTAIFYFLFSYSSFMWMRFTNEYFRSSNLNEIPVLWKMTVIRCFVIAKAVITLTANH